MSDSRTPTAEAEPPAEPVPSSESMNRQAATASLSKGEEMAECPACKCQRRAFLIIDGKCDSCRTKDEQAIFPAVTLGWPEVRQRRQILLRRTDEAGLEDYPADRKEIFLPLRVRLRNVTQLPDPMEAWRELDILEATIQTA